MVVFLVALVFVFVMADGGSDSDAPSPSESFVSPKAQQAAGGSIRHCSACGLAVKGHPGPCGKPKCVFGLVTKLEERVDELENSKKSLSDRLCEQERLGSERQEALLSVIGVLEERIQVLESQIRGFGRGHCAIEEAHVDGDPTACGALNSVPTVGHSLKNSPAVPLSDLSGRFERPRVEVESSCRQQQQPDGSFSPSVAAMTAKRDVVSEDVCHLETGMSTDASVSVVLLPDSELGKLPAPELEAPSVEGHDVGAAPSVSPSHDGTSLAADTSKVDVLDSSQRLADCTSPSPVELAAGPTANLPQAATFSSVVQRERPPPAADNHGFVQVSSRRNRTKQVASRLKGAQRVKCKVFHLSGVSPDSAVEDVLTFCRLKGVAATGCFNVRTRAWGTKTMKLFVEAPAENTVLQEGFWPEFVRCRAWLKNPPSASRTPSGGVNNQLL